MPTSLYMPSVVVEIAFNAGYTTPAASRTWTDVTDYVELSEGIDITYGRQDERSTADANQCSLTLDNSDGRFTAERAASPYYPNVKVGRPIRVKATPVGGSEQVRFTGFVDEWPVAWDGTDAYASARITASSRLARLGLDTALRSVVEEQVLANSPIAYYTLGEPQGATAAADSSGEGAPRLVQRGSGTAVAFGTGVGPGTDGLPAATFAEGKYLSANGSESVFSPFGPAEPRLTLSVFVVTAATATDSILCSFKDNDATMFGLRITSTGKAQAFRYDDTSGLLDTITSTTTVEDGALHHVALVAPYFATDPGSTTLYVDGVAEGTSGAWMFTDAVLRVTLGGGRLPDGTSTTPYTGTLAHFGVFHAALSAADVAAIWNAGRDGFMSETAATRLARYARWAGVNSAEVSASGTTTLVHVDSTGGQVVELMHRVELAEDGVLFDSRAGVLTLTSRTARYAAPTAFTLDVAAQQVEADFQPKLDRSTLLNDVTVANTGGAVTARVVNAESRDEYGSAAESLETLADYSGAPADLAGWRVGTYAEPRVRVPSLSVNILGLAAGGTPTPATVLAADVGTLIAATGQPGQAPATTATYFVEGYTESIGGLSYSMTFNLSPSYPHANTLILNDATRGQLDQGNLIAH